jgi:hypothetical protein
MTQYEIDRNNLIPEAEKYADHFAGHEPEGRGKKHEQWCNIWNQTFHSEMNNLARKNGIVK